MAGLALWATPWVVAGNCDYADRVSLGNLDLRPDSAQGLVENSGLGHSRRNSGVLWGLNDSDNGGASKHRDNWSYAISASGKTLGRYLVVSKAQDPEDLALGPGPVAGVPYLYWGEIGGNSRIGNQGARAWVWRFGEPEVDPGAGWVGDISWTVEVTQIILRFPPELDSQNTDLETLMVDPEGNLYVATKRTTLNNKGSRLYIAPYPQSTGPENPNELQFVAEFPWPPGGGTAVGGDISPDGSRMIILNRSDKNAYIFEKLKGEDWASAINADRYCTVPLNFMPQLEAVAWDATNGRDFYTLSEGSQQPLFFYEYLCGSAGAVDGDGDGVFDNCDNCVSDFNPGQSDVDGDSRGDACDNCPYTFNPNWSDRDGDGLGDVCDECHSNADTSCVACSNANETDRDGDGVCHSETVLVEEGSAVLYLANTTDPLIGLEWIAEDFVVDANWLPGVYGIGFETTTDAPNASDLINTPVPVLTFSVYTRLSFIVADVSSATQVLAGADYDDDYIVWVNGEEVFRSPDMPPGDPEWNTVAGGHESSNQADPVYTPLNDISAAALPLLRDGANTLAIGVWNRGNTSSDLVLVPRLSLVGSIDNCPDVSNPGQEDRDGDGIGDACDPCTDWDGDGAADPGFAATTCPVDNCPEEPNPAQIDSDGDGLGNACDVCVDDPGNDADMDGVCALVDNCPTVPNPSQKDSDGDAVADACDNCPAVSNLNQLDDDGDGLGNACDSCPLDLLNDPDSDGVCNSLDNCSAVYNPLNLDDDDDGVGNACDNCRTTRNPQQSDADGDLEGDHCDLDDGLIYVLLLSREEIAWQQEASFDTWNLYQGDFSVVRETGTYSQQPGSNHLASRQCEIATNLATGIASPSSGELVFALVTGNLNGLESRLGFDSWGRPRANLNPCP